MQRKSDGNSFLKVVRVAWNGIKQVNRLVGHFEDYRSRQHQALQTNYATSPGTCSENSQAASLSYFCPVPDEGFATPSVKDTSQFGRIVWVRPGIIKLGLGQPLRCLLAADRKLGA